MLVDSHCHLDFPDFADDLDAVIARAEAAGVRTLVSICTHVSRFDQVLAIAERYENVYCTVGVHPHNAQSEGAIDAQKLVALCAHPKVIGLGETGLDYFYEHSPKNLQKKAFIAHIEAARETGLPLIVHTRDADPDMIGILRREYAKGSFPGVIHCFSSGSELAQAVLDIGFYISVSGIATFKNAQGLRDTLSGVPLDRLLVETDAPYLAPMPHRGKRNEPAFTVNTAHRVAAIKNVGEDVFNAASCDNFFRLFTKARRPDFASKALFEGDAPCG
ncbi:TatD family hydrolase [Varunaivibrio sulfuroxidans]|uniref:TatD DNase family protein n=1 Tax=Varunaivibrio sulfuroxidans TaxID=1773489 RepID=A0A4R3JGM4_9PROT|nr:TatD family hydrolase [Varunaivibrio sulfuroxidans]TCS64366.1 TatD DNase family protein [Varunaivibrio sulfuroxidans]WES31201.1 TatD family hydrolase [Varunaivibrio sulfuroxidans]